MYPRPDTETLFKSYDDYLPAVPEEIDRWKIMMKPVIKKSAELIELYGRTGKGRVLDIGCGYGFFLNEMKNRGWDVEGIEISPAGRKYAQENLNLHVHGRPIEDLALAANAFDVVTLFYVIEHIGNPLGIIANVKRILKPGGMLLLRWPHSTPIVRILGPLANKLDLYHTPYHLYDFSPETISRLLILRGFSEITTLIAGNTQPSDRLGRLSSNIFGKIGEVLYRISGGNILLPGISKTTLAFKPGH
ncbi:MAG: class I SAM-dependent methyltransferase [Deltaproteobacteria bacterium]|nr:class I SAM-dependent methyltransferase [Deltaproteobacteria bacterium]